MKIWTRAGAALPRALRCPRRGLTPRRPATGVEPLCRHFPTTSLLFTGQPRRQAAHAVAVWLLLEADAVGRGAATSPIASDGGCRTNRSMKWCVNPPWDNTGFLRIARTRSWDEAATLAAIGAFSPT